MKQVFLNQTIGNSGVRQIGVQEFDIVSMVKSSTKYAVIVKNPEDIKYHLEKAYHLCSTGRPGPVWIDIPADIQNAKIELKKLKQKFILDLLWLQQLEGAEVSIETTWQNFLHENVLVCIPTQYFHSLRFSKTLLKIPFNSIFIIHGINLS